MLKIRKSLYSMLKVFEENKILKDLVRVDGFPDEPFFYHYSALINNPLGLTDGDHYEGDGHGYSFTSKSMALLKCFGECIERFCVICYRDSSLHQATYEELGKNEHDVLNPSEYNKEHSLNKEVFGWIKGFNLTRNVPSFLPAQLVYINYKFRHTEHFLSESNTTGAAGGFDHDSTMLRCIYEIIERDAFMTMYLAKISLPRIDLGSLGLKEVDIILEKAKRYNLELVLINLTNDLLVPSFLSILIDKTGVGPVISLGLKSSLDIKHAIIGSLEESFHTRPWMRSNLIKEKGERKSVNLSEINTIRERGLFWSPVSMLENLNFLINQKPTPLLIAPFKLKRELESLIDLLRKKDTEIYYTDISRKEFLDIGYKVYKVVIPKLQPLYLSQRDEYIKLERVETVAKYFGYDSFEINRIPQPFL